MFETFITVLAVIAILVSSAVLVAAAQLPKHEVDLNKVRKTVCVWLVSLAWIITAVIV